MKRISTYLIIGLFMAMGLGKAQAQVVDVCAGNDTVELHLGNFHYGLVQWQVSDDNESWMDIDGAIDTVYRFLPERPRYYRAKVRFPNCAENDYLSQVSYVQIPPKAKAGIDFDIPAGAVYRLRGNALDASVGQWNVIEGTGFELQDPSDPNSGFIGEEGTYKLTWTLTNSCGSSTDTVTLNCVKVEYNSNLVVVDETDEILSDSTMLVNGDYVIRFTDPIPHIDTTSILIGYRDDSFLRRVVSVEKEGDVFYLKTEQGYLNDVIKSGAFCFNILPSDLGDKSSSVKYLDHYPTRKELAEDPFLLRDGNIYVIRSVHDNEADKDEDLEITIEIEDGAIQLSADVDMGILDHELEGLRYEHTISLTPSFDHDIDFDASGHLSKFYMGFYDAEFEVTRRFHIDREMTSVGFKKSGKFNKRPKIVTGFVVGGVPVIVKLDWPYSLELSLALNGLEMTSTRTTTFTCAVEYNPVSDSFEEILEKSEPVETIEWGDLNGTLEMEFKAGPKLTFLVAGVLGPYVKVTGKIAPSLCVSTQPPFDISTRVRLGLDLTLGCKFQLFTELFSAELSWDFHIIDHTESSPKSVLKKGGDNQVYSFGNYLPKPINVDVKGIFGMPMKLANVYFEPQNGGEVSQSIVSTDFDGVASTQWKPGLPHGHDRLKVRVYDCEGNPVDGTPLTFHAYSSATDPCIESTLAVEVYHFNGDSITPLVTGGVPPYMYSLDDESYSAQQPTIVTFPGNNYTFYVRDAIGCEAMTTCNVPTHDCTNTTLRLYANVVGNSINAVAMFGVPPYKFSIDGVNYQYSGNFTQLIDGDYTVYVRDLFGCEDTKQVTVNQPGHIYLEISNIEDNQGTAFAYPLDNETLHDKGVCWSTHHSPTVDDFTASYGPAVERFTFEISSFEPNVEYYVRAYAVDSSGTSYSREVIAQSQQGITEPYVIATKIEDVTLTSAVGTGSVFWDGGAEVTERGICWSLNPHPTINDFHASSGEGMGHFSVEITDLTPHATYYARAYAINRIGVAYAKEVDFVAQPGGNLHIPEGAINGLFTIGNEQQVYFSQGNLQYRATTNTWRFADHQYDYIGSDNDEASPTYDGWIDIFAWGTSGYNHGAVCYQPWCHNDIPSDYYAYGDASLDLGDQNGQADWGYNPISNGGNVANAWRTLTMEEWRCLLYFRNTPSGIHFAKGRVNNVNGVLLIPDSWRTNIYPLNNPDDNYGSFNDNVISATQWQTLEDAGVVFMPAAGGRSYYSVSSVGEFGYYWTSSHYLNDYATDVIFDDTYLGPTVAGSHNSPRFYGRTVRLVYTGNPTDSLPTVTTSEVTCITQNAAIGGGNILSDGGSEVTERGICWSTSHYPSINGYHANSGSGTGIFTVNISDLSPSTTYYVRAYATNGVGTAYGDEMSFITLGQLEVTTSEVTGITSSTATCGGEVVSDGGTPVTERGVCWSTNYNPTINDSHASVGAGTGSFTYTISGLEANTIYYVRAYATNAVGTAYGNEVSFITLGDGDHDYVDLGLPSGLLWATCNVGANTPEEYGGYFAWGETQPKDYYDWSTYQHCMGSENTLTKYCTNPDYGYNGFTDNLTTLLPEDDAATTNWGSDWRMPTKEEWQELYNNTTCEWTTQNGVNGRLFTASNGNSLFLPATGYRIRDNLESFGDFGCYWSGSLHTALPFYTWCIYFYSNIYNMYGNGRHCGRPVRPVRSTSPSGQLPEVTTSEVTGITSSTATCGGEVVSDGGTPVTERGVCWSTNYNPTINDSHASVGAGTGSFTYTISGLEANTIYYVRAYATNAVGTAYGNEVSFITSGQLPEVTTSEVTGITSSTATCGGEVVSDGGTPVTERGVCWSTNYNPTINDSHASVGAGTGSFTYTISGLEANTIYYVRAYATNAVGTAYGNDVSFITSGGGDHDYVDLGLPSGLLWATCNVGANTPEEYGGYFAWGETQPKDYYDWSTYQYCMGSSNTLTKYCTNPDYGYNGFTDDLTILLPEDDAATANWGNEWRMPTKEEWQELLNNTPNTWTTQNGVNGRLFTAPNGNSLFLPAAGERWDDELVCVGSLGFYWSSSLTTGLPRCAWHFLFYSDYYDVDYNGRLYGFSVRAVRSSSPSGQLPEVTTSEVTGITSSTATCGGEVVSDGGTPVTERGVCWSTNYNPTINDSHASVGAGTGSFTYTISGLEANTIYYVRAYATNAVGTAYGNEVSFITSSQLPEVTTSEVTGVTSSTATCGGEVVSDGGTAVTERGVCWSTNHNPTLNDSNNYAGMGMGNFKIGATGLIPSTTYYVRAYATNAVGTAYGDEVSFVTSVGGGGDHDYVDLGLPSGLLWATCNVGANAPEEYGDHFAWGETQPKDYYDWSNYQYCMGSENTLTKYCYNPNYGYNGFTDDLTILQNEDDAALVHWGNGWRMPKNEEWQELLNNTTHVMTTMNGVVGWLFTASNGNSVFLPTPRDQYYYDYWASYWSSSLYAERPEAGWDLHLTMDNCNCNLCDRHIDCFIRPVRSNSGPIGEVPEGAINGLFSVAPDYQVYFSQGNLQYQASTNTWKFAENQWDYVGEGNDNISPTYDGWIDLFGWGTSGYDHGAICYQPWSISENEGDYYAYGSESYNLYDQTGQADWGYNPISNGGNQEHQWRTLTRHEWVYVFDHRNTASGYRFVKASVGGINGVVLLPDDWQVSTFTLNNVNQKDASYNSNIISFSDWAVLEESGAVFMPASGARVDAMVQMLSTVGAYWSSSLDVANFPHALVFMDDEEDQGIYTEDAERPYGLGVRLVHEGQGTSPHGYVPWDLYNSQTHDVTAQSVYYAGFPANGSCPILETGACWSTSPWPTTADNHIEGNMDEFGYVNGIINGLTPNTTFYLRVFVSDSLQTYYSEDVVFTTFPEGGSTHDYVDLGLPSGTLWATCNIGAPAPEIYGDYFAWGETQPKNVYSWSSYQYCNGSYNTLTKYCYNPQFGYNGFTDSLTILEPEDDVATAKWGADWRMPTLEECQELLDNTTSTWTTQNGVNGWRFTAPNGNSLFLPAAGCRLDDELFGAGGIGKYWSNLLFTPYEYYGRPDAAWSVDSPYVTVGGRCYGYTVRPVRSNSAPIGEVPEGAINGLFSIAPGYQIYFSKGNLQYIGSANTPYWKFADHQWDFFGDNGQGSSSPDVDRDLFGWGTSGFDHGAVCYEPWSTSQYYADYYAYGSSTAHLYEQTGQADWGYNAIINGGNTINSWRTLSNTEWSFLLCTRNTSSGIRFAFGTVNGVEGVIILPDDWNASNYVLNNTNTVHDGCSYEDNVISFADWMNVFEVNGAAFLPSAGSREGWSVDTDIFGAYWSSRCWIYNGGSFTPISAEGVAFSPSDPPLGYAPPVMIDSGFGRFCGFSVRLVHEGQGSAPIGYSPWQVSYVFVSNITSESADFSGDVEWGSCPIIEKGACWSTSPHPTIADNYVEGSMAGPDLWGSIHGLSPNTTYYMRAFVTDSLLIYYSEDVVFTTLPNGGDHDYVDLGLPSGLLWATCNVGANAPEEYGGYFAWGETQPKDYYDWSTYQHCMGSENTLTKYCTNPDYGYNGFTDDLTILLPEDDAVTVNWGNDWRMPTKEEWQELYQNTTSIWITQNGVNGRLFTAPNGNSLFLPAAGYCDDSSLYDAGIYGYYWSGSLYTDYPLGAWGFGFGSYYYTMYYDIRDFGLSVRAVRSTSPSSQLPEVTTSEVTGVTSSTAICGGEVVSDGGTPVTERGVCWSTNHNPTLNDNHGSAGAGTGSFTYTVSGLAPSTTYYVRAYATNSVGTAYSDEASFTTLSGGGDHDYVDLGLPSGLLWATCNVGANAPEEYGDHFAWGETQPKDVYNWDTYQYYDGSNLTKYTGSDGLTILLPEDDAATANWGNDWRMPTEEEWRELLDNTTHIWTTQNDVNGMLFTALNGNSLFLPAAGYRWDGYLYDVGSYGYYWSSTLSTYDPSNAWHFDFDTDYYYGMYRSDRSDGLSVRAVRSTSPSGQLPEVTTSEVTGVTSSTATCGGEVVSDGGTPVTERGVCWSTNHNPTLNDNYGSAGAGTGSFTYTISGLEANTIYYVRAYATNSVGTAYSDEASFTTLSGGGDHEYVDLGLPSGTLWATCNIGANSPEGYGDYFAWGETQPKEVYNWSTYQYYDGSNVTKYTGSDGLTILLPEDDAATVNWGNEWRMPTEEEWQELLDNTTVTWTQQNGVNGRLFTGSNGNSLFLPAAGGRLDGDLYGVGSYGLFWSCSLYTGDPYYAWYFYFDSDYFMYDGYRYYGLSVRAVRSTFPSSQLPEVTTSEVVVETIFEPGDWYMVATMGGIVLSDGGSPVSERGVCWGMNHNPSLTDNRVVCGEGVGDFSVDVEEHFQDGDYYVRAYAINNTGIAYGDEVSFFVQNGGGEDPPIIKIGFFSVNENGGMVCFSPGNLQYQASTNTWRFAENQWNYVGEANNNISPTYDGWIDLFGWGTSGYDHGAVCYQPWRHGGNYTDYYAYGQSNYNLFDQNGQADWGYNAIINGGNDENSGWRTLTHEDWVYLFDSRNTTSGIRYAKAIVNNVNGVILLPDDWDASFYALDGANSSNADFSSNVIDSTQWNLLEQQGVVFLPAAGFRIGTSIYFAGEGGYYWSSSCNNSEFSWGVLIIEPNLSSSDSNYRHWGLSVRLVQDAPTGNLPEVTTSEVTGVTSSTATCGGEVVSDGGTPVTERGVCWSTNHNPTLNDNHGSAGAGTGSFTYTVSGLAPSTTYYVRAYATNAVGTAYGNEVSFITSGGGEYEYVDLGLPSGLLWATCNVGANAPEEYGDYFAWGETQPKDIYNWSTYQYCMGSSNTLTKYCTNPDYGYNGFTDDLTILLPEDDAATVNWGNEWRMPTAEEWQELYQNTTSIWITQNGVNGRLFTAPNGNSLFLPAAGWRWDSGLYYVGANGYYWSSSLYTDGPNNAWGFGFYSGYYYVDGRSRGSGQSVRAVRSASPSGQLPEVTTSEVTGVTSSTATCGGEVVSDGGTAVTERGVCWSTNHNPTLNDNHGSAGAGTGSFTYTISGLAPSTTYYVRAYATNAVGTAYGDEVSFTTSSGGGGDHDYVDLGLPSGLLWATCNVGADTPEGYGDYFAWGETQPKDVYNWDTYQYYDGSNLTKYTGSDGLTILLPEDDAATANWGNEWRMPTEEEWQELYQNTTVTWTQQNGVNGRLFTAPNGNSLFLPAAGFRWDGTLRSVGSHGLYWSSSLDTGNPYGAWYFYFNADDYFMSSYIRYGGLSVRAVRSARQN